MLKTSLLLNLYALPQEQVFLTGTYPHIHGVNQNNKHVDPDWSNYAPYSSHLQKSGYETAHIGKIHMAWKRDKEHIRPGFDYWFSFIGQGKYFDQSGSTCLLF